MRLCVMCEGHTAAAFIKSCLEPHLRAFNVIAYPSPLKARPGKQGGGRVTVERLVQHLRHEYHHADRITRLWDFYGFGSAAGRTCAPLAADILRQAAQAIPDVNPTAVLPWLQMHEFAALLFSDIEPFPWVIDGWNDSARQAGAHIRAAFASPQDIDNSPATAPSKRILQAFPNGDYNKTEHGPIIAAEAGIARLRKECGQCDE